jgi:RHS repeat-associated protein
LLALLGVSNHAAAAVWEYTVDIIPNKIFKTMDEAEGEMRAVPTPPPPYDWKLYSQLYHKELYATSQTTETYIYHVKPRAATLKPWVYWNQSYSYNNQTTVVWCQPQFDSEDALVSCIDDRLSYSYPSWQGCSHQLFPLTEWFYAPEINPVPPADTVRYYQGGVWYKQYRYQVTCTNGLFVQRETTLAKKAEPICTDPKFTLLLNVPSWYQPNNRLARMGEGCQNGTLAAIYKKLVLGPCNASGDSDPKVGNPCSPATGNKHEQENDYAGGTSGLSFERFYNSLQGIGPTSALGVGWSHTYSGRLVVSGTNPTALLRPDGYLEIWSYAGTDTYVSSQGTGRQLRRINNEWVLTNPSGDREIYGQYGRLLRLETASGLKTSLGYDTSDRLAVVTGPYGHTLTFGYDATSGKLASVTDPANQVAVSFAYTGDNLTQVTYSDGTWRSYHYDDPRLPHHLTGISDNGVRYSTFAYDDFGRATLTEHAGGMERFTLTYNADGTTTVTDAAGQTHVYSFNNPSSSPRLVTRIARTDGTETRNYDYRQRTTSRTNGRGVTTTYAHDAYHRTSQTEASGKAEARTTTYQYLANDSDLPTVIESPSVYPGAKKRITIAYGANRRPASITQGGYTPSGVAVSRSIALAYNANGQVTSIDGPRTDVNDVTALSYYECTGGGACGQLRTVTNAAGQTTTFDSHDSLGRLTQITDANGVRTSYTYDGLGRVATVTYWTAGGTARTTQYSYMPASMVHRYTPVGMLKQVTFPDGRTLTYDYNAARLLAGVTDNLGNRVAYGYDTRGNRNAEYTYDPSGTLVRQIDMAHDLRNRVSQINAAGSITQQVYDAIGNLTSVIDPNNNPATTHQYDALNRLTKTIDALSGNTTYGYDVNDRAREVKAPNNATTTYQYDDLGNLLQETSPDRGTTQYTSDAAGNVLTQTDARSVTATYSYDALNRVTSMRYAGGTEDVSYAYDTCTNGVGRVCNVTDAAGTTSYDYDAFGNVATQIRSEAGFAYTTRYTYDAGNRIASVTYPDGRVVQYTRNSIGQVGDVSVTVNSTSTALVSGRTYRADGLLLSQAFGNGLNEIRQYDLQGRLSYQSLGSADTRVYGYDPNSNLTSEHSLPQVGAFGYDALNRLTQSTLTDPTASSSYGYDANGNRTSDARGSYSYLTATNRLSTAPGTSITLDPAGNMLSNGPLSFGYNNAGHLAQVTGPLGQTSYSYDAQRLRTRKTSAASTTVYHYDLQGRLIAESRGDSTPLRAYVWDDGQPIAQIEYAPGNERLYYLHTDHLATPRLATDSAQRVVWRHEGEAFGASVPNEDPDGDGQRVTINLRFPGQYYDAETGLHYNWNRYYDPKTGRYITSDPIGLDGGQNTYVYTNNPLLEVDPEGLMGHAPGRPPYPVGQGPGMGLFPPGTCGSGWNEPFVPDNPFGYQFAKACGDHDRCYDCRSGRTKKSCDDEFCTNLKQACKIYKTPFERQQCERTAGIYCNAVRKLGQGAFDNARRNCCAK